MCVRIRRQTNIYYYYNTTKTTATTITETIAKKARNIKSSNKSMNTKLPRHSSSSQSSPLPPFLSLTSLLCRWKGEAATEKVLTEGSEIIENEHPHEVHFFLFKVAEFHNQHKNLETLPANFDLNSIPHSLVVSRSLEFFFSRLNSFVFRRSSFVLRRSCVGVQRVIRRAHKK